jgi:steroid delta-isomerase
MNKRTKIVDAPTDIALESTLADVPNPERIRNVFAAYAHGLSVGDADCLAALFAPDGVLEDPVGTPPHVGREAIRRFFQAGFDQTGGRILFEPEGAIRIRGPHAACAFIATCDKAQPPFKVETVDVARFDSEGQIVSMTAVLGPANFHPL